jgi:hypothetical protein
VGEKIHVVKHEIINFVSMLNSIENFIFDYYLFVDMPEN